MIGVTVFRKRVGFATYRVRTKEAEVVKVLSHGTRYQQFSVT